MKNAQVHYLLMERRVEYAIAVQTGNGIFFPINDVVKVVFAFASFDGADTAATATS